MGVRGDAEDLAALLIAVDAQGIHTGFHRHLLGAVFLFPRAAGAGLAGVAEKVILPPNGEGEVQVVSPLRQDDQILDVLRLAVELVAQLLHDFPAGVVHEQAVNVFQALDGAEGKDGAVIIGADVKI